MLKASGEAKAKLPGTRLSYDDLESELMRIRVAAKTLRRLFTPALREDEELGESAFYLAQNILDDLDEIDALFGGNGGEEKAGPEDGSEP